MSKMMKSNAISFKTKIDSSDHENKNQSRNQPLVSIKSVRSDLVKTNNDVGAKRNSISGAYINKAEVNVTNNEAQYQEMLAINHNHRLDRIQSELKKTIDKTKARDNYGQGKKQTINLKGSISHSHIKEFKKDLEEIKQENRNKKVAKQSSKSLLAKNPLIEDEFVCKENLVDSFIIKTKTGKYAGDPMHIEQKINQDSFIFKKNFCNK